MIKVILKEKYTKRDIYGNVYHTVTITNVRTNKHFTTQTPSLSNVVGILNRSGITNWNNLYTSSACTGSARISSLPTHLNLNCCNFDKAWKQELNKIGFRIRKEK